MKSIKFSYIRYVHWLTISLSVILFSFLPSVTYNQSSFTLTAIALATPAASPILRINEVNSRAARHFRNHFSDLSDEKWTKIDGYFVASFDQGPTPVKVYYNSKGVFAQYVKSYFASSLADNVKLAIQKKFGSYTIDVITEISNLQQQLYFVKIKNERNFKTLRVVDNVIDVVEDMQYVGN